MNTKVSITTIYPIDFSQDNRIDLLVPALYEFPAMSEFPYYKYPTGNRFILSSDQYQVLTHPFVRLLHHLTLPLPKTDLPSR